MGGMLRRQIPWADFWKIKKYRCHWANLCTIMKSWCGQQIDGLCRPFNSWLENTEKNILIFPSASPTSTSLEKWETEMCQNTLFEQTFG